MWQNVCIRNNNMDKDEGDKLWPAIELSLERWRHEYPWVGPPQPNMDEEDEGVTLWSRSEAVES